MKTRIIHTKIWKDPWFADLLPTEKLLFIYFVTNEKVNIIHLYEVSSREIAFDLGLTTSQIEQAKIKFQKANKLFFKDDYVFLVNAFKYEQYTGEKNDKARQSLLNQLPKPILGWYESITSGKYTPIDTPIYRGQIGSINHKSEIINHKTENKEREEKSDEATLKNPKSSGKTASESDEAVVDPELKVLEKWNEVFKTNFKSPRSIRSNLGYWLEVYELDQILEAIERIQYHKFWRDKMSPTTFLRRKNPRGEDVDYIGTMLNETKIPKRIEMSWDDEIPRNPEIPQDQVERNLEKIKQMKRKLGVLSV